MQSVARSTSRQSSILFLSVNTAHASRHSSKLDSNREKQRLYARDKRRREKEELADEPEANPCQLWETMPFHAKVILLAVWGAARRARKEDRAVVLRGLAIDVDPRHGLTPAPHNVFAMYRAVLDDAGVEGVLDLHDVCEAIGRLVAAGWLEFTTCGVLEDGSRVDDEPSLLRMVYPSGFVRGRLLSGAGDEGELVRQLALHDFALCDSPSQRRVHLL